MGQTSSAGNRMQRQAQWRERIARQSAGGQTIEAFCRGESVSAASFYTWRKQLRVLRRDGVIEAGCMAHARRYFMEVWKNTQSPLAQTAITEIARLYAIERDIQGLTVEERQRQRQSRAGPLLDAFRTWLAAP